MNGINFTDSPKAIGEPETLADHVGLLNEAYQLMHQATGSIVFAFDDENGPAQWDEVDIDKAVRCARAALLHLETVKFRIS